MISNTRDGSAELADASQVSHEHVLVRLRDWRDRVHGAPFDREPFDASWLRSKLR